MAAGALSNDDGELPPEAELAELVRLTRAHLEWHRISGSLGVPPATAAELAEATTAPVAPAEPRAAAVPLVASQQRAPAPVATPAPPPAPTIAVPADPEARRQRLTVLEMEARACTACALHQERTQAVFARGTGTSGLVFVGEGPGADEDVQGFPFVGAAGQLLDRMIAAMGLGREDVYVCNIVKCRPPKNRKPEPDEMAACSPFLIEQLALLEPQVIVALGATAVQGLLGTSEGITRMRGKWKLYRGRIAVMPTFHPAYLLRTPSAKREVWQDLQEVLRHMGRAVPTR